MEQVITRKIAEIVAEQQIHSKRDIQRIKKSISEQIEGIREVKLNYDIRVNKLSLLMILSIFCKDCHHRIRQCKEELQSFYSRHKGDLEIDITFKPIFKSYL